MSLLYADGSVFTVGSTFPERRLEVRPLEPDPPTNDPSFDLAVIQFDDSGVFVDRTQLEAAENCIRRARSLSSIQNGAIVVLFMHGWHHDASWLRSASISASEPDGDTHFHAFRLMLESLALREAERYPEALRREAVLGLRGGGGRRVVGIYMAWNGNPKPPSWLTRIPRTVACINSLSFWNRYATAQRVGAGADFRRSVRSIMARTKETVPALSDPQVGQESPLVLIGHSMGALMLERAFLAILEDKEQPLTYQPPDYRPGPVSIRSREVAVSLPDLLIALNSAAYAGISRQILKVFAQLGLSKLGSDDEVQYAPPLLVSATSKGDRATRVVWRMAQGIRFWRKTDGNDRRLRTHVLVRESASFACPPRGFLDLGQNWHCLRKPVPPMAATPSFSVDLPTRERCGREDNDVPHDRYSLRPLGGLGQEHLMWAFSMPTSIVRDHNDIFNSRARSLILALIQISGAVASLAEDWKASFEPEK